MEDHHKQALQDQYDDAVFALLMDEYAEAEGERLWAEFEQSGTEMPSDLDAKCRRTITRAYGRKRLRGRIHRMASTSLKAALVAIVLIGAGTATVMSVDAMRRPVLEYITTHFAEYTLIKFDQPHQQAEPETTLEDPLSYVLPEGFVRTGFLNENGLVHIFYENDQGQYATFHLHDARGTVAVDTEGAEKKYMELFGYEAMYAAKPNEQVMLWLDEDVQILYQVSIQGLSEEIFLSICEELASMVDGYYEQALAMAQQEATPPVTPEKIQSDFARDVENMGLGHREVSFTYEDDLVTARYENPAGDRVQVETFYLTDVDPLDGVAGEAVDLDGHEGILIQGDVMEVMWVNQWDGLWYHVTADNIDQETFLTLCRNFALHSALH